MQKSIILLVCYLLTPAFGARSSGCGGDMSEAPQPGHHLKYTVSVNDPSQGMVTRDYIVHVPTNYDHTNNVPTALVLDFHGWTYNAERQIENIPWTTVADNDPSGGDLHFFQFFGLKNPRVCLCEYGWNE